MQTQFADAFATARSVNSIIITAFDCLSQMRLQTAFCVCDLYGPVNGPLI